MKDSLMVHYISTNLMNNAAKFCHNSIQGHAHSLFGIQYHADKASSRWAMGVGCLLDLDSPAARYGAKAILKRPILGCGVLLGPKKNFLVISDLHIPFQHKDAFEFLKAVAKKYKITEILCVGDLYDHHKGSYHESEVDAPSAEEEYALSKMYAAELQSMFPKMVITVGNHDAIPVRKLKSAGLPVSMLTDMNKLYETKPTWTWCQEYWFDSKDAKPHLVQMVLNKKGRWIGRL
jgi:hypothetical protein